MVSHLLGVDAALLMYDMAVLGAVVCLSAYLASKLDRPMAQTLFYIGRSISAALALILVTTMAVGVQDQMGATDWFQNAALRVENGLDRLLPYL